MFRSPSFKVHLNSFKLLTHWYVTPVWLHKASPAISPRCWKKCGELGSYVHLRWDCPLVQQFWTTIITQSESIIGYPIPKEPKIILLNLWSESDIPLISQELASILFLCS